MSRPFLHQVWQRIALSGRRLANSLIQTQNTTPPSPQVWHVPADWVRFGPLSLSPAETVQHMAAIGATGSGKTTVLRLLLQGVVPTIRPGSDARMLIYDPKRDVVPLLRGMSPDVRLIVTNPFDHRGSAWDLSRDIREPRVAIEMASTLIPVANESQPFFSDSARHLLAGVLISYMWRKLDYSFADVLRGLSNARSLKRILRACPHTQPLVGLYFTDRKLVGHILSTIATKLMAFGPIAASWEHAMHKFSIEGWIKSEAVLVLGCSETSSSTIEAINSCLFKRACDLTLDQNDSASRRSWFVIDELSEAGKLPGLGPLIKKGRSKGAAVVLAFQSIEGLRSPQALGVQLSADVLAQVGHRFIGKLECPETARWASQCVGEQEIRRITVSHTYANEHSVTYNETYATHPTILPSEFLSLPTCNVENGLTAFYLSRNQKGVILNTLPGADLYQRDLVPPCQRLPGFVPRSPDAQYLRPWTPEEEAVFAPPPQAKGSTAGKKPPAPDMTDLLDGMHDL